MNIIKRTAPSSLLLITPLFSGYQLTPAQPNEAYDHSSHFNRLACRR